MSEEDQSIGNDVDGVVNGPSFQAGTVGGDVYVNAPGKLPRGKAFWCLTASAAVVVAGVSALAVTLARPDESGKQAPGAALVETTAASGTTSSPVSSPPATSTAAGAARPAPVSTPPRPPAGAPTTVPSAPTPTFDIAAAPPPPPAGNGVRFSGMVTFGSYNLDLLQPRRMDGHNVWPLTPGRLHGDEGYWLAEWAGDGVPGRAECDSVLTQRPTRDAENLVVGSRVCGKTPEGRIFLVEVAGLDSTTINGQVTVWD